ncbi:unnamed protein product, partial [Ectocarpus sp. 13 AM-2016]
RRTQQQRVPTYCRSSARSAAKKRVLKTKITLRCCAQSDGNAIRRPPTNEWQVSTVRSTCFLTSRSQHTQPAVRSTNGCHSSRQKIRQKKKCPPKKKRTADIRYKCTALRQ